MGWARRVVYGILWRVWGAVAIHTHIHTYIRNSWVWGWYIHISIAFKRGKERGSLLRLRVLFRDVSKEITNYIPQTPNFLLCSSSVPHIRTYTISLSHLSYAHIQRMMAGWVGECYAIFFHLVDHGREFEIYYDVKSLHGYLSNPLSYQRLCILRE